MPFGFADWGIRCAACGKFVNIFTPAIPGMPDPFAVTCPYCGRSASYPKSAITSTIPAPAALVPVLGAVAIIVLLVLLTAYWRR